jgi:membrane protein
VFAEIQDSINDIWGLKPKPKKGWLKMITNRLLSFSVIISLGFVLLVSLIVNGLIETLMDQLKARFPDLTVLMLYIINLLVTFAVTSSLFAIIFKVLPDAIIKWKDVTVGSMVTAVLFMIGKFGITFYIGKSDIGSTYGAAGSMVVLLVWVYYSSIILYFGAEFTKAYAKDYGSTIRPNHYAVWVKHVEVEEGRNTLKAQEEKKKEENDNTGDHIKVV